MFRRISKKRAFLALSVVAVLALAGGAVAYFTNSGSGQGTGTVGSATNDITVTQTSTVSGLLPGGPSEPLFGTLSNGGTGDEYVTSVTAAVTAVSSGTITGDEACMPGMFSITGTSTPGENIAPGGDTLVGGGTANWSGLSVKLNDDGNNQDNCENATLTIAYTSS